VDIRDGIAVLANFLLIGGLVFGGFTLFAQYHATGRWAKNVTNLLAGMGMLTLAFALTLKPRNVDVLAELDLLAAKALVAEAMRAKSERTLTRIEIGRGLAPSRVDAGRDFGRQLRQQLRVVCQRQGRLSCRTA